MSKLTSYTWLMALMGCLHFFCFLVVFRENEHYLLSYYLKPHTRYGPFLIGILTGIYLKKRTGPLVKQKVGSCHFPQNDSSSSYFDPPLPSGRQHWAGSSASHSWLR